METGRILALDLGKKRIGLAVCDALGITVQGLETMERKGRRTDIEFLRRLTVTQGVKRILMGDPIHMSGEISEQSEYTHEFAKELEWKTGLPVFFRDERLTSWEAEQRLQETNHPRAARRASIDKGAIDKMSAMILLQDYLDSLGPTLLPDDGFDEPEAGGEGDQE